jgi:hemerythrin
MEIKLNTQAKEQRILNYYNEAMEKIAKYAEDGFDLTEHVFPKDIYSEVRNHINNHMSVFKIKFAWISIGDMNSVAVGEGRLMRFKILN